MTIYLDENFPPAIAEALRILQAAAREGDIAVRHVGVLFPGAPDEEWLPQLEPNAVVVTQDLDIHKARQRRVVYEQHNVVVVVVRAPKKKGLRYWEMVSLLIKHWEQVKEVGGATRPAAYQVQVQDRRLRPL